MRAPRAAGGPAPSVHAPATTPSPGGARVAVSDRQRRPLPKGQADALASMAMEVLTGEGVAEGELTLSFVGPAEIEDLHVRYMDEPGPTDVLSFPLHEDGLLGDVVVCPAVAAANDRSDPDSELRLLVVHGVLHVVGYDHQEESERARTWASQERY